MRVQVPPLAPRKRGRKCGDCGGTGVIVLDPLNDNGTKSCAKCEKREAKKKKAAAASGAVAVVEEAAGSGDQRKGSGTSPGAGIDRIESDHSHSAPPASPLSEQEGANW